jgi:hypothetical protein
MTNSAAGLAEKAFGAKQRTLVINCSTNLPEFFLMLLSFSLNKLGGIATPIGSNLSNIFLILIVAPIILISKWLLLGQSSHISGFIKLIVRERKLFFWHLIMSLIMFVFSCFALWFMTGIFPFLLLTKSFEIRTVNYIMTGGLICLLGVIFYLYYEHKIKKARPQLFEDIEEKKFQPSWKKFFIGTGGVILSCYILNLFFLEWSEIYGPPLKKLMNATIFTYIHYFIGSLISSIPEIVVAIENYERVNSSDLNTALASASVSNMSNLAIAFIGSVLASFFTLLGLISEL